MKTHDWLSALLIACAVLLVAPQQARAEAAADAFSTEQLEQIVAPIALYPDALLTQILMASTYPLEIVEAQRWRGKNPTLEGEALDAAMKEFEWDPSVKSLAHLPDVLKRMNDNLDWTQDLGDAFLGQQAEVMDTVQRMRGKAKEAGNLKTSEQQVVKQNPDQTIIIESSSPEVIYVPDYSPTVVYGSSWYYPTWYYPPMYPYYPPGAGLITFGLGMAIGGAIWGDVNWGWGDTDINIDIDRYNEFNRNTNIDARRNEISGDRGGGKTNWNHDPSHRKGVNYKNQDVAGKYGARGGSSRVSQADARGRSQAGASNRAAGGPQAGTRDLGGRDAGGTRTSAPGAGSLDRGTSAGQMGGGRSTASASTRDSSRSSAYSGSRSSSMDRAASSRGSASRGSPSFSGGGMRGGGGRRR